MLITVMGAASILMVNIWFPSPVDIVFGSIFGTIEPKYTYTKIFLRFVVHEFIIDQ